MISRTGSITIGGLGDYDNSVEELLSVLNEVPAGATYDISHSAGDRPWESSSYRIIVEWDIK